MSDTKLLPPLVLPITEDNLHEVFPHADDLTDEELEESRRNGGGPQLSDMPLPVIREILPKLNRALARAQERMGVGQCYFCDEMTPVSPKAGHEGPIELPSWRVCHPPVGARVRLPQVLICPSCVAMGRCGDIADIDI